MSNVPHQVLEKTVQNGLQSLFGGYTLLLRLMEHTRLQKILIELKNIMYKFTSVFNQVSSLN